jgi:hypothetical protein
MFLARSPIRSRSVATRIAPTISRRSTAIGWRRAMVRIPRVPRSRAAGVDLGVGRDHALAERDVVARISASTESTICVRQGRPSRRPAGSDSCRSLSNALAVCSTMALVVVPFAHQPNRPVM